MSLISAGNPSMYGHGGCFAGLLAIQSFKLKIEKIEKEKKIFSFLEHHNLRSFS